MIPSNKKIWLIIDLVISLGLLGIFKYLGFATEITHALFGIPNDVAMQTVGVGFIIGVIQDSVETALNSSSDVVMTATAEWYQRKKAGEEVILVPKNN